MNELFGDLIVKKVSSEKLSGKEAVKIDFLEFQSCAIMGGSKLIKGYFESVLVKQDRVAMVECMDINSIEDVIVECENARTNDRDIDVLFIADMFKHVNL